MVLGEDEEVHFQPCFLPVCIPLGKQLEDNLEYKPHFKLHIRGFPGGSDGKESACSAADPGSILGSGRSPGKGNSYPLQYSCLENSMDREEPGGPQSMGSRRVGLTE